ncbi:hypothetical protein N7474_010150 [Penicillium riverlandense]|uniref:uncharacterized protein n=1 Tax=Penicillium riverlandense TaxID=1903569 RepID=UPI0025490FFE|nr:uncharacterized protein N7474_010150 [Penicillium riverlandense]KAJ5808881.1 hypothetical protein N7474_010150 [Penicillium riverlandense]
MADRSPAGKELAVPPRGDPDRRRVLGVLAQRRYRDRKKLSRTARRDFPSVTGASAQQVHLETPRGGGDAPLASDSLQARTSVSGDARNVDESSLTWTAGEDGLSSDMMFDSALSGELQDLLTETFEFPDDRTLEVPALKVMRAAVDVATRLNCLPLLWNPASIHIVGPTAPSSFPLPQHFFPVSAQLTIPHHPLFDILPWPTVRTKFINAFALPSELRPPSARDPLALMHLVYDMDDEREGCRISGCDGMDVAGWEIGQRVFDNWWWALDRDVLAQSNRLRYARGARCLTLGSSD